MDNNEKFLGLFKKIESILETFLEKRPSDSATYMYELELKKSMLIEKKIRGEKYATIRQLRNILAHEDIDSSAPFVVSDATIQFMESEIEYLEHQETAMDVCVPLDKMLYATRGSKISQIATKMITMGVSNVPVFSSHHVSGMFTGKSFIHYLHIQHKIELTDETRMEDILDYIQLDMHDGIQYLFVSKNTKLDMLEDLFRRTKKGKVELLIVTETGDKYEDCLGVISPHDILERR